ncbi:MAG: alkaline phosphatase family protein [Actinobacteria bacterium]|nr:alkaline phosphatase family protein [Actinomycetota bacterium]
MSRPNVLFITVDEWRAECLSAAGHPIVQTPNLDRLAAQGIRFTQHYANCAPCGPSRATLLTGQYLMNHRSGTNGTPLDDRFTNIAREARSLGYDPVLFGYTDTSLDPRLFNDPTHPLLCTYEGVLPGFTEGLTMPEPFAPWLDFLRSNGHELDSGSEGAFAPDPSFDASGRGSTWAPARFPAEHSISAFLTDELLDHLRTAGDGWFVHASYLRPHPPWRATREHHERYDPADMLSPHRLETSWDEAARHPFLEAVLRLNFVRSADDELEQRQRAATYYALMNEVDDQIGRVLDWLDASGHIDDTLVLLTCDHGEQLGDHWMQGKLGWFDESYHIPLIIRDPRATADGTRGTTVDAFTENVDIMPTLLDWLGVDPLPLQCDGRSVLPFLHGSVPAAWREDVRWEFDFRIPQVLPHPLGMRMDQAVLSVVRTADRKYVHFPTLPMVLEDLADDPSELRDVSAEAHYRDDLLAMKDRMLNWRIEHADRTLTGMMLTPSGVFESRDWPR